MSRRKTIDQSYLLYSLSLFEIVSSLACLLARVFTLGVCLTMVDMLLPVFVWCTLLFSLFPFLFDLNYGKSGPPSPPCTDESLIPPLGA